jgi:hypothetical protein
VSQFPTLNAAFIDVRSGIFEKGHTLSRYSLDELPINSMAVHYKTVFPDANLLKKELVKTRLMQESNRTVLVEKSKGKA